MKALDMSPRAISERLEAASDASDLSPETRLDAKLDMSRSGVTARLREASDLYDACLQLAALGRAARGVAPSRSVTERPSPAVFACSRLRRYRFEHADRR